MHHTDHHSKNQWEKWLWWIGTPVVLALLVWGPYLLRALILGHADWWRIPLVGDAMFDTAAYLQPTGRAVIGIQETALLGPIAHVIRWLATIFPSASVAEIWLITRWLSAVAAVWIGAWMFRSWTDVTTRMARFLSAAFWFAIALVLSMKPGMMSWFLPLGLAGFAAVPLIEEALTKKRYAHAVLWTVLAAALTSVYAWYFLFIVVWAGVVWFLHFGKLHFKTSTAWYVVAAASASLAGGFGGWWVTQTEKGQLTLQLYERLSLSPTHMPFVSGSVLLIAAWILLLIPVVRRAAGNPGRRAYLAVAAWMSLLFCFLSSPFTGHFIQNDHYRTAAAIASWLTLALVWNLTRSAEVRPRPPSIATRWLMNILLVVSAAYALKILFLPYAWNGDFLNVTHLTHWLALLFTILIVRRWMNQRAPLSTRVFAILIAIAALITGGVAWSAVLIREFKGMSAVEQDFSLFRWINTNTDPETTLCADHIWNGYSLDDQLAAITGRIVHFSHTTMYLHEGDAAFLDRMRTVAPFYDVRGAGDEGYWELQSSENQFIVCEQFPWQTRIFKMLGLSQDQIDGLTGCPRTLINNRWAYVTDAINHPKPDADAFKQICPVVVIPDRTKPYWHLPDGYSETRVMDDTSVWSLK
jgi:hypothetical protein